MTIYKGIEYSSPTLASAISNLSPAFTFVLAVIFRFFFNPQHFFFFFFLFLCLCYIHSTLTTLVLVCSIVHTDVMRPGFGKWKLYVLALSFFGFYNTLLCLVLYENLMFPNQLKVEYNFLVFRSVNCSFSSLSLQSLVLIFSSCLIKDGNSGLQKLKHYSQNLRHCSFNIRCFNRNSLRGAHSTVIWLISIATIILFSWKLSENIRNKLGSWWPFTYCLLHTSLSLVHSSGNSL